MPRLSIAKPGVLRSATLAVLFVFVCGTATPAMALAEPVDATATNHNDAVTATETTAALRSVPGLLGASDQVATKSDSDSAIVATTNGTTVDVPKDPEQGISFGAATGPKIDVELPSADQAGAAKAVAPGVVAYDSGNGSANAVQANEDGSVRMLTIIDNQSAPTEYDYKVTVPNGGRIETTEDGGAVVLDANNEVLSAVGAMGKRRQR